MAVRLRDVRTGDVEAYVRMRCDAGMMASLGGPLPREGIEDKVRRDAEATAADRDWIRMIVLDEDGGGETVAGSVTLWSPTQGGEPLPEIGWMVLPEHQGRGLATWAVGRLLEDAREDGRWGAVHAFPAVGNGPSNGLCRSLGFAHLGERETEFAGRTLLTNHWMTDTTGVP